MSSLAPRTVRLPKRKIHKTPRLLTADSYTISSDEFASEEAKRKSIYYITFRRILNKINPDLYAVGDNRIVFVGLPRLLDFLFYDPITHGEIDETKRFLEHAKVSTTGLKPMNFPEKLWRLVVDKYNGRPPIKICAMPEGSIVYPNEPIAVIENMDDGDMMGELAAWFESTLLKVWASSEYVTQLAHWYEYCQSLVYRVYGNTLTKGEVDFKASLMLHNFGCRAAICPQESEWLGADALYIFPGTDTFSGAYQAWKNANEAPGVGVSVFALAHRNVQGYENEDDCYQALYDALQPGEIGSFVADCYSYYDAVERKLLQLAKQSKETGVNKIVVARPDSGVPSEQVLWLCKLAHKNNLSIIKNIDGKEWRFAETLKFIEGDSMDFKTMKEINEELLLYGFPPFEWGVPYGVGGGLRNNIKRDNLSAKYALAAVGEDLRPVCKFSETLEKTTLPGPFKVRRDVLALNMKQTIEFPDETTWVNQLVEYFNGADIWDPFKPAYDDDFLTVKERIHKQLYSMPKSLTTDDNHNYPASNAVRQKRIELLKEYAPKKLPQNY